MSPKQLMQPVSNPLAITHLQVEMARIEILVHHQVKRWQAAGQNIQDPFRGLHINDQEINGILKQTFAGNWGQLARLDARDEALFSDTRRKVEYHLQEFITDAQKKGQHLPLEHLRHTFGLSPFEMDAFLLCLAPCIDLRYEKIYGFLQNDVTCRQASISLILDILAEPEGSRLQHLKFFEEGAALLKYHLIEQVIDPKKSPGTFLSQPFTVEKTVVEWLLGHYQPQGAFSLFTRCLLPGNCTPPSEALISSSQQKILQSQAASGQILAFTGIDSDRINAAVHFIALTCGVPLLFLDLDHLCRSETPSPLVAIQRTLRDSRLIGAIPCFESWDTLLNSGQVSQEIFSLISHHPGLVILTSTNPWQAQFDHNDRSILWNSFNIPDFAERKALWQDALAQNRLPLPDNLDLISGQFWLTSGQIRACVAAARDMSLQQHAPFTGDTLLAAARASSNPHLGTLAREITPRYSWNDIVLPENEKTILHEIVNTVRCRPVVLDDWGVGQKLTASSGVTILFAGPPGTGKTMAAEVIASELGLSLYKIELSTIVSKYIGETEKNLEQIFSEAQNSNAILFFDEADAIFGKRSEVKDAHDRYANIEVSYLLQRMEAYDGVTILATNLRSNLDEAFTRRLSYAVDFPFPDEHYRELIWKTLFPPHVPCAENLDFRLMARRFKLAGGSIRNIIVGAAYLAAAEQSQVSMKHLLHSTRRELQKMGRLVNEADMSPV